jgi:ParB/RepB/Spo0J family partition protein
MSDHESASAVLDGPQEQREMHRVPLSRIEVRDGHNPRHEVVRDDSFTSLVATVRQHGVLQPLRVVDCGAGRFELVAGERRYWAAVEAACIDVPVIVRSAGESVYSDLLVEALIENEMRVDLNPIERAKAYQRLRDGGLTLKGVAERLGRTQKHVRETLAMLDLPERIQTMLVDGGLPRYAVPSLLALGRIHPQFPEIAVDLVTAGEEHDWSDVRDDPVAVVYDCPDLPDGVYRFNVGYPAESFALTEKAERDLKAILRLSKLPQVLVVFRAEEEQAAAALKALHASPRASWAKLLVGADVAAQLACDQLAARATALRREDRALRERQRDAERAAEAAAGGEQVDAEAVAELEAEAAAEREAAERERQEQLRKQQEEAEREQAAAVAYNDELGAAVINNLSVLKVDARIMKILAAVPIAHAMPGVAARGAAYGFPGWPIVERGDDGKCVRSCLGRDAAAAKADEYLAGAKKPGEIAGRMFALLVMAIFVDRRCVPVQLRSDYMPLVQGGPWRNEVGELIDQIVAEKLPLRLVQPKLDERKAGREAAAQQVAAQETIRAALARVDELTADEVQKAEDALPVAWSEAWHPERRKATAALTRRRTTLAEQADEDDDTNAGDAAQDQEDETPLAAAA